MNTIVSQRFIKCHNQILSMKLEKSSSAIALRLNVHKQAVNDIIHGKRDVTVDMLRMLCEEYQVNTEFLLLGKGNLFQSPDSVFQNKNNIIFIPVRARAGYANQINDPVFHGELESFSLPDPRFSDGQFRCFEVDGDSMEPTYNGGDYVVCSEEHIRYLSQRLKTNETYVIVTTGDILLKRVINSIEKDKTIELKSDNEFYPPIKLKQPDIKEVWKVECKISKKNLSLGKK